MNVSLFGREPVVITNAVTEIIRNFILLLIGFSIVNWTEGQVVLVLAVVGSTMALINIVVGRSNVTPMAAPNLPVGTSVNSGSATVVPASEAANELVIGSAPSPYAPPVGGTT